MIILIIVGATIFVCSCVYLLMAFVWSTMISETSPRITFSAFKKLYAICPAKWSFGFNDVGYHGDDIWVHLEFKHYLDVLRYGWFKNKVEKHKAYLEKIQNEKDFVASIQNDIDSYRRENLAELERIITETRSNKENLSQKAEVNNGGDDY